LIAGQNFLFTLLQERIIYGRHLAKLLICGAIDDQQRATVAFVPEFDMHHAIGVFVGVGIEQDSIDNAEDSGGSTNAKRERKDSGNDKSWRLPELTKGEAKVLKEVAHVPLWS